MMTGSGVLDYEVTQKFSIGILLNSFTMPLKRPVSHCHAIAEAVIKIVNENQPDKFSSKIKQVSEECGVDRRRVAELISESFGISEGSSAINSATLLLSAPHSSDTCLIFEENLSG
eukprot:scaffold1885_cov161-Ochromonas_danica.AAC.19